MDGEFNILKDAQFYGVSFVASVVSYKDIWKKEDSWRLTLLKFSANFATSLFAGWIAYQLAKVSGIGQAGMWLLIGVFSWRGSKGLEALSSKLDKWIDGLNIAK